MERFLTVYYKPGFKQLLPLIRLQGAWLLKLGFQYKDRIKIVAGPGKMTITKIPSLPTTIHQTTQRMKGGDIQHENSAVPATNKSARSGDQGSDLLASGINDLKGIKGASKRET